MREGGGRGRVCMYVPMLYPVVSKGAVAMAGGIEVQLALLAKGLAERGFEVTVVTCDFGQPDGLAVDGYRLLKCWRPEQGLPVVRFLHPRLSKAIHALRRADADVYIVQGAGLEAGLAFEVAHSMGRPFEFVVAHDHDVLRDLPDLPGLRSRLWFRRAIAGASGVVSQTEKQRRMLRDAFGRDSIVIMNPVEIPEGTASPASSRRVVWVATYKAAKRPEWFTRMAERHPELECVMVGVVPPPPLTDRDYRDALEVAQRCPNLEVRGPVPHERISEFLREAALFTHTSAAEGFPNVFLEAWSVGLPSVTCFDPDGIIAREDLGEKHDTFEAWEAAVVRWMTDAPGREAAGLRARDYARRVHASGEIHDRFAAELDRLVGQRRGGK
jgi:glycosyltransferase involved in cell wall biosynthesis